MSQSHHHRQVTMYLQAMRKPQPWGSEALRTGGQDHSGLHTADLACLPSDVAAILTFFFHFHQLFLTFLVPSKEWIYTISLQEVHLHSAVLRATMTFFPRFQRTYFWSTTGSSLRGSTSVYKCWMTFWFLCSSITYWKRSLR